MTESMKDPREDSPGSLAGKSPEFLNYFGKDRPLQLWFADLRTRLIAAAVPPFTRIGLAPDTISYTGIALLAGVVIYFVRQPAVAVLFILGHMLCDGLDGAFARHAGKASQSGAFTDLCCDQLGMVVVAMMAIFHHMVSPLLGTVYISLYLIVVVFGVIINVMGVGTRITVTSKYFLYTAYAIWAFRGLNWFGPLMTFFSAIMAVEVLVGYIRLKTGLRRKFDSEVRYGEGDSYSGKLNYAVNVSVPITVLLTILIGGNLIPLRTMIEAPRTNPPWIQGPIIVPENEDTEILGFGVREGKFLVLTRDLEDDSLKIRKLPQEGDGTGDFFVVPDYVNSAFSVFPVDDNVLLLADQTTHLLMGIDLDASFASKQAVMVFTLPLGWLRVTAMAVGVWKDKKVWLAANYLYTRRTYLVDPQKALKKGFLLGGRVASYINGGFPAGVAIADTMVVEFNKSPLRGTLYGGSLTKVVAGSDLLDAGSISLALPEEDLLGPVRDKEDLIVLSREGRVYRLPLNPFVTK
jgi:phosphatidylglycerophosphate synthase